MVVEDKTELDVVTEVEVMLHIAQALGTLKDADARRRVLRWAMERYHADESLTPAVDAAPRPPDPCLSVEELGEFFSERPLDHEHRATATESRQGVETLIRGFAADFRRFALEWQGA